MGDYRKFGRIFDLVLISITVYRHKGVQNCSSKATVVLTVSNCLLWIHIELQRHGQRK